MKREMQNTYVAPPRLTYLTIKINYMDLKYMKIMQQDYLTCMHINMLHQGLRGGWGGGVVLKSKPSA